MRATPLALLGLLSACWGKSAPPTDANPDAGHRRVGQLEVNRVILGSYASIRSTCYEEALRRKPGLGGTVTVRLAIDPSGAVTKAEALGADDPLGGDMLDPDVVTCVVRRVNELTFPALDYPAHVVFPLVFEPRGDDGGVEGGAM